MAYAIFATSPGGPDRLEARDIAPPAPSAGEVLIRQTAIGVNFLDIYIRTGLYPWPVERDLILGSEGAGVVEALGDGVTGFEIGQRVAYTIPNGAYATHRLVPAASLVALPDSVSDVQAAGAMLKGLTTYYLLHDSYAVKPGDTVLFHAAAGGVGLLAGQWRAAKGARAIGTAGGPEKCTLARTHGYAETIDYRSEDFIARVQGLAPEGLPVVYDSVGRDTVMGSLQLLAPFGTLVAFGQSSGPVGDFKISDLARGSLYLQRPTLFHYATNRPWLERAAGALFQGISGGTLSINVTERGLRDVAQVHSDLADRKTTGSVVLVP
jgi:NADPH2:quinone reductase